MKIDRGNRSNLRIAILISGELRNWKQTADHLFNLKEILERDYFNNPVDVYGHTWIHSYTDDIKYADRFTDIFVEDQDIISDWVSYDIPVRGSMYYDDRDGKGIKITTNTDLARLAKNSNHNYAQTAGFGFGLRQVPLKYDYVIRTRWDNEYTISRSVLDETLDALAKDKTGKNIFLSYQTKLIPFRSDIGGLNNLFQIGVQDHYFIIPKSIHSAMNAKDKFYAYETIMGNSLRNQPPMDHGMWSAYLGLFTKNINGLMIANLPQLAKIVRPNNYPGPINKLLEE